MTARDPPAAERVVVLDVVGLEPDHLRGDRAPNLTDFLDGGATARLQPAFPALTVPSQTTLATGQGPGTHGDVASGEYDRERDAVEFWGRARDDRTLLWESATEDADLTTGALFFQHLLGASDDLSLPSERDAVLSGV